MTLANNNINRSWMLFGTNYYMAFSYPPYITIARTVFS